MDQTEKIVPQQNEPKSQNNPESQKGPKKLSNNGEASLVLQPMPEKPSSQNASQNGSRSFSQTGSQMDQQIMRGLNKKQKRRYTTFLEVLGIDVQERLSKKQDKATYDTYDGQNPQNQQFQSRESPNEKNDPNHYQNDISFVEQAQIEGDKVFNGGNFVLVENESEKLSNEIKISQKSNGSHKIDNRQSQALMPEYQLINHEKTPTFVLQQNVKNTGNFQNKIRQMTSTNEYGQIVLNQPIEVVQKLQSQHGDQAPYEQQSEHKNREIEIDNQPPFTEPKQTPYTYEDIEIDGPSRPPQTYLRAQNHYQSEEGEMSMENNYDPFSNAKPVSDFSYDMINSIYTPVSHFKVPNRNPNEISLDNDSNAYSSQHELAIVMEEFKHVVEEEKDIEIDGPSKFYHVHEERMPEIHENQHTNEPFQYKDVQIDGPSPTPQVSQEKDVEIDGPSPIYRAPQIQDLQIDGPSPMYQVSREIIQNERGQENIEPHNLNENPQNHNSHIQAQTQQKSSLHVVQEAQHQDQVDTKLQNSANNRQFRQNTFSMFNPSARILKAQSQNNDKSSTGFPKPKKNSQTSSFQNNDHKTAEGHPNRRKFSESSRSAGLNSVNNKISSHKRPSEFVQGKNPSLILSQNNFDSRELQSFQETNEKMNEIEEQNEPHDSVKMTPNANSFSNRSEKSSIKSKRSNRFSDEVINQKQVPPLESLQLIRDGKEPRLERKSRSSQHSNRSNNSRSASTCKKSYDDLSEIHMEKIDQNGEELQEKSIKRSVQRMYIPSVTFDQVESEKFQLQSEIFTANEHKQTLYVEQDVEIDGKPQERFQNGREIEKRNENYSIETSYIRPQEQKRLSERKENFTQTVSHQIAIHFDKEQQDQLIFDSKSVQCEAFSEASSRKTTQSQKIRQKDEYLESQRKRKMNNLRFVPAFEISIENPLPMEQRLDNTLIFCKEYLSDSHHSKYERQKFKEMLDKNFEFFGTQLDPTTDLGQRMFHDGIFACTFIFFVKQARNSGMLESLMFTQFEEDVGIRTNKQVFLSELKRVKQEREMHYNNDFQKRLKDHEERRAKEEARKMQMNKNIINQTVKQISHPSERKVLIEHKVQKNVQKRQNMISMSDAHISKVWSQPHISEESSSSILASSETMTVDEKRELSISPVRKSRISDMGPKDNQSLIQETDELLSSLGLPSIQVASTIPREQKKVETKKVDQPKKRVTKIKERKPLESPVIVVKIQQTQESADQTVSQVQQKANSQIKQKHSDVESDKEISSFGHKQKPTKGILRPSKLVKDKDSPANKEKKQKKSPSKKDLQKVSRKKKQTFSKQKQIQNSNSNSKNQKKQSRIRNTSRDNEEKDLSVTRSPRNKISIQKAVEDKVNQGKIVKFTNSTKGGETSSNNKRMNLKIIDIFPEQDPSQEQKSVKRALRSRSKKQFF